jgi:catechol 2,3-dioxygenase-like lactoylglutathione lyase family enzyme
MIKGIDHVQLAMPRGREAEARAFYEGLLGIPERPKPEALAKRGGCWFERGELKVHLGVDSSFVAAKKAHPAFVVDGLVGLLERLEAAGVPVTREGAFQAYVEDPFGNRIELLEPQAS